MESKLKLFLQEKYNVNFNDLNIETYEDIIKYGALENIKIDIEKIARSILLELRNTKQEEYLAILKYLYDINYTKIGMFIAKYYKYELKYYDEAIYWYAKLADQGDEVAMFELASMHSNIRYNNLDIDKSIKLYSELIMRNNVKAMYYLAQIYYKGEYVPRDYKKAFALFTAAANNNDVLSQHKLAIMYRKGEGVSKDLDKSIYWYRLIIDNNKPSRVVSRHMYYLASLYKNELKDYDSAFYWYSKSSEMGNEDALVDLGLLYLKGQGVEQDSEYADSLLSQAAESDRSIIYFRIGLIYKNEIQDYEKAFYYFSKSVEKDQFIFSLFNLAQLYRKGRGVQQDYEKAISLYMAAAKKGYDPALYQVAVMYEEGIGFEKDINEAKLLYKKVIHNIEKKGIKNAPYPYYRLGYINYYEGNYNDALKMFSIAKDQGYNCDFILSRTNAKLGIEDKENYIFELANSTNDVSDFMIKMKDIISNTIFESKSITQINTGLITYFLVYKLDLDIDYSNCILPTIKALETEIRKYFIFRYKTFLEKIKDNINEKTYIDTNRRINSFKLGNFKDLVGLKEKNIEEVQEDKEITGKNFNKGREIRAYVIDVKMLKYLKTELFDLTKFSSLNQDEEIIEYMRELCELVDQINHDYRNPSAHENIMSKKDAETIINWLLFNKRIFFRFFEMIR